MNLCLKTKFAVGYCLPLVLLLSSCAHKNGSIVSHQKAAEVESSATSDGLNSFHLSDKQGPEFQDEELNAIPTEVNPLVEKWIDYFKGKGREHMERYLARSTRYEKLMKKVLRDNGLPEDLFYIALIESGFTSRATSHASAVGYWQFIRGTGKRYGLEMNKFVDDRRDPVFSTQAAAEYFKGLYSVFGSWYLAMASYNVGENRVKKEVMKNTTRDFWELAKKSRLPKETINYVPKFIAAKLIAKNPEKYGFEGIDYLPPVEFDSIRVANSVNLRSMAEKLNINYEDFKAINPRFKGEVAPAKSSEGLDLRIPPGMKEQGIVAAQESAVEKLEYIADQGETEIYRIHRGDSLHTIARKYRTTVAYLRDLNDIPKGKKLRVGMKIMVPDRTPLREKRKTTVSRSEKLKIETGGAPSLVSASQSVDSTASSHSSSNGDSVSNSDLNSKEMVSQEGTRFYIVQNGDSLFSIAQKYNTTVAELKKINRIRRGRLIKVGIKLRLPADISSENKNEGQKNSYDSGRRFSRASQKYFAHKKKKRIHIVKKGESLNRIAEKYNVGIRELKTQNKIRPSLRVFVGEKLLIPQAEARY